MISSATATAYAKVGVGTHEREGWRTARTCTHTDKRQSAKRARGEEPICFFDNFGTSFGILGVAQLGRPRTHRILGQISMLSVTMIHPSLPHAPTVRDGLDVASYLAGVIYLSIYLSIMGDGANGWGRSGSPSGRQAGRQGPTR